MSFLYIIDSGGNISMKNSYREFFAECMPFLKMAYFLKEVGISPVTFSRFMKGEDFNWCLSEEKCAILKDAIDSKFYEFIA